MADLRPARGDYSPGVRAYLLSFDRVLPTLRKKAADDPSARFSVDRNPLALHTHGRCRDLRARLLCSFPRTAVAEPLFAESFHSFETGDDPTSVAIEDLNGDGKPDLAAANFNSGTVSVLLGNGNGTFGTRADYATGFWPSSVAIGELNGDGKPDLAVANSESNTVSVLLGNGDGTFGAK